MGYRVAVVGATGNVGRAMLDILAERAFPAAAVVPLASARSVGATVAYGDSMLACAALDACDFQDIDLALFSAGGTVARDHAPRAAAAGCVVIDNSSCFRYDADVPLVVPEVNREALAGFRARNIVANPNCSTAQMVVALKPLHDLARIRRVVVATYQSVSGAGRAPMDELRTQTESALRDRAIESERFPVQIAFNVIPHIDAFLPDGSTREEWKMVAETRRILDPEIDVIATCVRVPVLVGHAEAVNVEFSAPIDVATARQALEAASGIALVDRPEAGGYATPIDCAGRDETFVSRLRQDSTVSHGLSFWCVSDNLRKGAALNAVQIAEALVQDHPGPLAARTATG